MSEEIPREGGLPPCLPEGTPTEITGWIILSTPVTVLNGLCLPKDDSLVHCGHHQTQHFLEKPNSIYCLISGWLTISHKLLQSESRFLVNLSERLHGGMLSICLTYSMFDIPGRRKPSAYPWFMISRSIQPFSTKRDSAFTNILILTFLCRESLNKNQ